MATRNVQFKPEVLDTETELNDEIRGGDRTPLTGPYDNFSLKGAYIRTDLESYVLYVLFPGLSRRLTRRISETLGAVAIVPSAGFGGAAVPVQRVHAPATTVAGPAGSSIAGVAAEASAAAAAAPPPGGGALDEVVNPEDEDADEDAVSSVVHEAPPAPP